MKYVLFVEDHPIYRDGVQRTLEAAIPDLSVLIAGGAADAARMLDEDSRIDLCLADYRLPDGDGLALISQTRLRHPSVAVGILCGEPTPALSEKVRAIGGVACLSKEIETADLIAAITAIFEGDDVFEIARDVDERAMSTRRRDILDCASRGWPDKQIGEKLGISESTVRNHWHHIFRRLGVNNRTEAVTQALKRRLIARDGPVSIPVAR